MKKIVKVLVMLLGMIGNLKAMDDTSVGKEQAFHQPFREFAIIVTPEGYYPEKISVFSGEKIRFIITSTSPRSSCFTLPGNNIFLSAEMGKITISETVFKDTGMHEFYCPGKEGRGKITVLKKLGGDDERGRGLASIKNGNAKREWMPRKF